MNMYYAFLYSDGIELRMPRTLEAIELVEYFLDRLSKQIEEEEEIRNYDLWFSKKDKKFYQVNERRLNYFYRQTQKRLEARK